VCCIWHSSVHGVCHKRQECPENHPFALRSIQISARSRLRSMVLCGVRKEMDRRGGIKKRRWRIESLPCAKKTKLASYSLHQGHSHLQHAIELLELSKKNADHSIYSLSWSRRDGSLAHAHLTCFVFGSILHKPQTAHKHTVRGIQWARSIEVPL
jgi:hypothetical protein